MKKLHFFQTGLIKPLVDGLNFSGINPQATMKRAGLDKMSLDKCDNHIPMPILDCFLKQIEHDHGIENIATEFLEYMHYFNVSSHTQLLTQADNLLRGIKLAKKCVFTMLTNAYISYQINGERTTCSRRFTDSDRVDRTRLDHISFVMSLNAFRLYLGDDWEPLEVHLQSHQAPNLDVILPKAKNTKVYLNQREQSFVFHTSDLFRTPSTINEKKIMDITEPDIPTSATQTVTKIFDTMQQGYIPSLLQLSEMMNLSERTLRRRLVEESTNYIEILDQWRFKKAINFLQQKNFKIKEISEILGYNHVPNFERAFRRWTQTSPLQFLENQ